MIDNRREGGQGPDRDNGKVSRTNVGNTRNEQLNEELRGMLKKKNEENRRSMNERSENRDRNKRD